MKKSLKVLLTMVLALALIMSISAASLAHENGVHYQAIVDWSERDDILFNQVDHYRIGLYREVTTPTAVYWEILCGGWIGPGYLHASDGSAYFLTFCHFESTAPLPENLPPETTSFDIGPFLVDSGEDHTLMLTVIYKAGLGAETITIPVGTPTEIGTGIESVRVQGVQGVIERDKIAVELDSNARLSTDPNRVAITTLDPDAQVKQLQTNDGGKTWTFDVKSSSGFTVSYTIDVSVKESTAKKPTYQEKSTKTTVDIHGVAIPYTMDAKGKAILLPSSAQLDKLIALDENGILDISLSDEKEQAGYINGLKSAMVEIDLSKIEKESVLSALHFSVFDMQLSLPINTLRSMQKLADTLRFGLTPGSLVFELTDADGKVINWYDYKNPATVSIGYDLPQDISTYQIVMIREGGEIVPRSWYSKDRVYAKVYEAGTYDAALKSLGNFTDTDGLWMDAAVGYMAARGIVNGVADQLFDPQGTVTRAHFLTMLMRALDASDIATTRKIPVSDYDSIPDWARAHVITASALGITLADEAGNFNPNEPILRQDMFFMTYQAMEACGMLPQVITEQWIIFLDWENNVKAEYTNAIQTLCKLGLVDGYEDGTLKPNGSSTRAEGMQFLYNLLKYAEK